MKYDIEKLKQFIKFYIPHRSEVEDKIFGKYFKDGGPFTKENIENGTKIPDNVFENVSIITIKDSIVNLNLEYTEEQLKEVLELYTKYQEIVAEEIDQELEAKEMELSDSDYEYHHMHKLLTFIIKYLKENNE